MMRKATLILGAIGTFSLFAAPEIDNDSVSVTQAGNRRMTISYKLKNEDAIVTLQVLTNGVPLPGACVKTLSGDVCKRVKAGDCEAYWQPKKDFPDRRFEAGEVSVKLTAWSLQTPPDYLLVDLGSKNGGFFYADLDSLPYGHPTNSAAYKTTYMLMRKIPASGVRFRMGSVNSSKNPSRYVSLSDDYYMSVFEMTEGQMKTVRNGNYWSSNTSTCSDLSTRDEHPVTAVNFNEIRRVQADATPAASDLGAWPENGHKVGVKSILYAIRDRTGIQGMDLPTAAQWEYACRAGRGDPLNVELKDGQTVADVCWYDVNSDGLRHPVGRKLPNAWGLYDMHGNIEEWVLDVYSNDYDSTVEYLDPIGPSTSGASANRMVKSANYTRGEPNMDSSFCTDWKSDRSYTPNQNLGFRLICPVLLDSVGVPLTPADEVSAE